MVEEKPQPLPKSEPDGVKISNPERVVFPDSDVTKGELADYYRAVAQPMPEPAPVTSATFPCILGAMTLTAAEDTIGCSTTPEGAVMDFEYSKKTKMYMEQLTDFMNKHVVPNEQVFADQLNSGPTRWQIPPIMEDLKAKARERGLWNLFLPESERGAGLTNLEYAPLCEIMGRSPIAPGPPRPLAISSSIFFTHAGSSSIAFSADPRITGMSSPGNL